MAGQFARIGFSAYLSRHAQIEAPFSLTDVDRVWKLVLSHTLQCGKDSSALNAAHLNAVLLLVSELHTLLSIYPTYLLYDQLCTIQRPLNLSGAALFMLDSP